MSSITTLQNELLKHNYAEMDNVTDLFYNTTGNSSLKPGDIIRKGVCNMKLLSNCMSPYV